MGIGNMLERIRSSLFFVPSLFGVASVVLAEVALFADERVENMPARLTSTVDSARAVLGVTAGATVTFTAIAFSVSLLLISAASSQFSPRIVHGLFRDPFNKRVMGIAVGTFVYCLVILRAVRGPLEDSGGTEIVPSISVLLAVLLGFTALMSIVAFINHAAHSMEISTLLHGVVEDSLAQARKGRSEQTPSEVHAPEPDGEGFVIDFATHGWVQTINHDQVLAAVAPRTIVKMETVAGRYAITDVPICRIWPAPDDPDDATEAIRKAVVVGTSRTMQQDDTYGIRQLADVALKALSPGINDPTTAQDALFHLSSVVREILAHPTRPTQRTTKDGKVLLIPKYDSPEEIVGLAFDEVRIAAIGQPTVQIYLLEILRLLIHALESSATEDGIQALRRQADMIREDTALGDLSDADRDRVRAQYDKRFRT